ncbi:hypothetical protein E4U43_005651 [Claviceps pusilla]|uniref:Mur ligase central domain-containing protein n=1 Tax=Claviceps pusilla TaxID=123648 RepID=A0A9P7STY1_9HYPO|nr:hypothetical protein E4U43_005651 [Claviceps pusilla]
MPASKDIQRALARIRAVMPAQKKAATAQRNIKLGLERISRVVADDQRWTGVHVGGTNGKGSICALLAAMFKLSGISHGTYISPALPERHHGITINGLYVNRRMYEMELQHVEAAYKRVASGWTFALGEDPGDLTPFEIDTAAAFRVFNKMNVQYGIVEVGMGGATDATNAMKQKAVTVISKIDLDHQEYLGNTVEEIAQVKAGIMRSGVPCIVDHTNSSSVIDVLRKHAQAVGTQINLSSKALPLIEHLDTDRFRLQGYEQQNLLCATLAFRNLFPNLQIDVNKLLSLQPRLPGRMEQVSVSGLTNGSRQKPVLVDGAHNMLGVKALATYVDGNLRKGTEPVTWVMGFSSSKSKPFSDMIEALIRPQDNLAFVEYTQCANDPPPAPAELGRFVACSVITDESQIYGGDATIDAGVRWACSRAGDEGPLVVTGSLYMIRELYKMQGVDPSRKIKTRRPGRSQLWRYIQLSRERPLTSEEAREFKQARRHWRLSPANSPIFRGERPASPVVPERIRKLQQAAAHHRNQADGYQQAIRSIKRDLLHDANDAALSNSLQTFEARRQEHLQAYNRAMFRVRGHVVDREKKYLSHEEIFGKPERVKNSIIALLPEDETDSSNTMAGDESGRPARWDGKEDRRGKWTRRRLRRESQGEDTERS